MEIKKLVDYIDVGQTADAVELGLDSKFQLECINHHLLTRVWSGLAEGKGNGGV